MKFPIPQYDGVDFYKSPAFWTAVITPLVAVLVPYLLQFVPFPIDVSQAQVITWLVAAILGLFTHRAVRTLRGLR